MTNEMDTLVQHQPPTTGPASDASERATRSFAEFLARQSPATTHTGPTPTRRRWYRRPLAIAGLAAMLLAGGGVAIAVIGDGVFYVEEATEITEIDGLTLVVQESNIGPCLQVHFDGGMAGGCGADLDEPLSVSTGGIRTTTFASGWAPPGTAKVEMTFSGGEVVKVTNFETAEEYDIVFFVVPLPPSLGDEPPLPLQVVAYNDQGDSLATVSYADGSDSDPQHDH